MSGHPSVTIGFLGPTSVTVDGAEVVLTARRQRAVLAHLALRAPHPVPPDQLLDAVWGDDQPSTGVRAVAFQISKLRSALEPDRIDEGSVIITSAAGYALDVDPDHLDIHRFERLVSKARELVTDDPARCRTSIDQALGLWRGRPFADLADRPLLDDEIRRLEQRRLLARRTRAEALIAQGRHVDVVVDLESMIDENPFEEALVALLMTAMSRAGRTADALHAFADLRRRLGGELGLEPSNELRLLEQQLLDGGSGSVPTTQSRPEAAAPPVELPSGLVTFVFTDIEGSTRLYRRIGDRYPPLLARHDELLRRAFADAGGHEVKSDGDSFLVAFANPDDAIRACAAAQQALTSEPWPVDAALAVRMGIHCGLASATDGDYVAYAVHQAARIVDAGHGGQIVVSADVARIASHIAPLTLVSRGRHQVRDFDQAIELFEVRSDAVPIVDRRLRVRPADGHNLVPPLGPMFDRAAELTSLRAAIREHRLVSLVGPGGMGKTRLALEAGLRSVDEFPDGVWFAALDAIDSVDLVPGAVLEAASAGTAVQTDPWSAVKDLVGEKSMLLVLDNCEHLLPDLADRLAKVLTASSPSVVLTTSRVELGLRGEHTIVVGPLPCESTDETTPPAIALFLDRAPSGRDVERFDIDAVGELCDELDGLPLAIELAAARAGVLMPEEMLDAVRRGRPVLKGRDPTLPRRHRTLEALLDWSYRLLDETSAAVLRRLSVMPGDFDVETATTAAAGDEVDPYDVPEALWSLVDHSLVRTARSAGSTRYELLRTIRRFAGERRSAEETDRVVEQLSARYLERFGPAIELERSEISRLGAEVDNIRALIEADMPGSPETKQRLAITIGRHHDMAGTFGVGIEEVRRFATQLTEPTATRVSLLTLLADLELRLNATGAARRLLDEARHLSQSVGLPPWDDACVERTAGGIALRVDDPEEARRIAEKAMERPLSLRGVARINNLLGIAQLGSGELERARASFEVEAEAWTELGNDFLHATALGNVAEVSLRRGRASEAARYQQRCLRVARQIGHETLAAFSAVVAAQIALEVHDHAAAVRLQVVADQMLEKSHYVLYGFEEELRAALLEECERALGDQAFSEARTAASALSSSDALAEVARVLGTAAA